VDAITPPVGVGLGGGACTCRTAGSRAVGAPSALGLLALSMLLGWRRRPRARGRGQSSVVR
jgi:hypothetical protein